MATTQLRTRIDTELIRRSEALLKSLGMDTTTYVSMALAQLVNRRGVPFAITEADVEYFANEYGLTKADMTRAGKRMKREYVHAKKSGALREISGPADLTP